MVMEKVLKILNLVLKILAIAVLGATTLLSLGMAYIMFAPDEWPKPFRLAYQYAEQVPGYLPSGVLPAEPTSAVHEGEAPAEGEAVVTEPGGGLMVDMSTKIINLSDPTGRKYIRLTVVLEFVPDPAAEEEAAASSEEGAAAADPNAEQLAKINARMPLMDDMVITILSSKTYEDLYTADGKELLRKEIQEAISQRLPELNILSVYFTEFVVQ